MNEEVLIIIWRKHPECFITLVSIIYMFPGNKPAILSSIRI